MLGCCAAHSLSASWNWAQKGLLRTAHYLHYLLLTTYTTHYVLLTRSPRRGTGRRRAYYLLLTTYTTHYVLYCLLALRVVELRAEGVSQAVHRRHTMVRIELHELDQHVKRCLGLGLELGLAVRVRLRVRVGVRVGIRVGIRVRVRISTA